MEYKDLSIEEKKEFWRKHVEAWKSSGLSQLKYCKENRLVSRTFVKWKSKLTDKETSLVKIPRGTLLNSGSSDDYIEIIKGSSKIRINSNFESSLLLKILKTLESI